MKKSNLFLAIALATTPLMAVDAVNAKEGEVEVKVKETLTKTERVKLEKALKAVEARLVDEKKKVNDLVDKINATNDLITSQKRTVNDLLKKSNADTKGATDAGVEVDKAKAEVDKAQTALTEANTALTEANTELDQYKEALTEVQNAPDHTQEAVDQAQAKVNEAQAKVDGAKAKVDSATAEKEKADTNFATADGIAKTMREKAQKSSQEHQEAKNALDKLNGELAKLNASYKEALAKAKATEDEYKRILTQLNYKPTNTTPLKKPTKDPAQTITEVNETLNKQPASTANKKEGTGLGTVITPTQTNKTTATGKNTGVELSVLTNTLLLSMGGLGTTAVIHRKRNRRN